MMTSCAKESFPEFVPTPGKDVSFSASLNTIDTRTIYGVETNNQVPVNWVHGDTITVYGSSCVNGRKQANYVVNTIDPNNTTAGPQTQNFAWSLDRVGGVGVQWGETASDFYSIYPATKGTFGESEDGKVTVTTTIRPEQKNKFEFNAETNTWIGTPYMNDLNNPTMRDALMYAYTPNATATDSNGNPNKVDLQFHPFSTVLKFRFLGWGTVEGNELTGMKIPINKIVLTAPNGVGLAGDCTFTFTNGQPTASNGTVNTITVYPNYLPLEEGQAVEFHVFAIPQQNNTATNNMVLKDGWSVTLDAGSFGIHTFSLKPKDNTDPKKATLQVGKIHKISVPKRTLVSSVELPENNWMNFIPRNVYLSELSVPGSWYSTEDSGDNIYQSSTIAEQYAAGVRAFHIDCRLTQNRGSASNSYPNLVVSGTEGSLLGGLTSIGTTVASQITEIARLVTPNEYAILVLTIAQKYKSDTFMGEKKLGTVDPLKVLPKIYEVVKAAGTKIYGNEEGEVIDANTTVNDVLGHLIVKVNVNTTDFFSDTNYGNGPCVVTEGSMASDYFEVNYINPGVFNRMNTVPMYWGNTLIGVNGSSSNPTMYYYYHHAQQTTSSEVRGENVDNEEVVTPSLGMRMDAIDDIILQSEKIYSKNLHNGWFQLGIGGWTDDNNAGKSNVARKLNSYLKEWIDDKRNGESRVINGEEIKLTPSPVGIVLMNYATSNDIDEDTSTMLEDGNGIGLQLIRSIIDMNTQFYLNRNTNQEEWPNGNNPYEDLFKQQTQSTAYAIVEPLN